MGFSGRKNKFAIVLHNDGNACILTTFTTSQLRSSTISPVHGKNPEKGDARSYVFKSGVEIGVDPVLKTPFSFKKDTTVVPDYGIQLSDTENFSSSVSNLRIVCVLNENEYTDLIYTLYRCKKTKKKYKDIFERILGSMK